jgi:hypothetical protein
MDRIHFVGAVHLHTPTCVTEPPFPKRRPGRRFSDEKIGIPDNSFEFRLPTQNSEEVDRMTGGEEPLFTTQSRFFEKITRLS